MKLVTAIHTVFHNTLTVVLFYISQEGTNPVEY